MIVAAIDSICKKQHKSYISPQNSNLNFWRFLLNHFRSVFPLLLLFSWLSTILFIGREIHETVPISKMFFTFLQIKNFFVECLQSTALQTASGYKRKEFWCETRTPLWLLIGCIIYFSHLKKHFCNSDGGILYSQLKNIKRSSYCVGKFMT